jgi:hypothetical protein
MEVQGFASKIEHKMASNMPPPLGTASEAPSLHYVLTFFQLEFTIAPLAQNCGSRALKAALVADRNGHLVPGESMLRPE